MLRSIEVRAWNKELNEMEYMDTSKTLPLLAIFNLAAPRTRIFLLHTGLKDKNGTGVFDGDILQNAQGRVCKVVWFELGGRWDATYLYDTKKTGIGSIGFKTREWIRHVTVIGNIYQNPELLKEQKEE